MRSKTTSEEVSKVAGRVLKRLTTVKKRYELTSEAVVMVKDAQGFWRTIAIIDDLEAISGSCLTQVRDRKSDD